MKKKITMLYVNLLLVQLISAQVGASKQKDVEEIKNRTLLVVVEEPSAKLTTKLKGEELVQYNSDIEEYNKNIKEAAVLCWKFNDKIEYKTREEVMKLNKAKNAAYAYLEYNKFTVNTANAMAYKATLNLKNVKSQPNGTKLIGADYISTQMNIRLCEDNPLGLPVYGIQMPGPFPNKADLAYGLKAIQLQLNYKLQGKKDGEINKMLKENGKKLEKLTLLVDKQDTNLSSDEIKKCYPYPVELVTKDKIDEAILNSDTKYAFAIVLPYTNNSFAFQVLDVTDCSELARSNPDQSTGVSVSVGPMDSIKDLTKNKIKKDHFKIFAKNVK